MEIKELKITEIQPYYNNPRNNSRAIKPTAESIRRFGFTKPILVDKNNIIIAGHTRYEAAIQLGLQKVPVVVSDTEEEKIKPKNEKYFSYICKCCGEKVTIKI